MALVDTTLLAALMKNVVICTLNFFVSVWVFKSHFDS